MLEPYIEHGPVTPSFILDKNKEGTFYTFTTTDAKERIFLLICKASTEVEVSLDSQNKPLYGVYDKPRGQTVIPYSQLQLHGCVEVLVRMNPGGV